MTYGLIRHTLADILGVEEGDISPETRLWRGMDAVSFAKLILACEAAFRVSIPDERAVEFCTVRDLIRFVAERVADGVEGYRELEESDRTGWFYE